MLAGYQHLRHAAPDVRYSFPHALPRKERSCIRDRVGAHLSTSPKRHAAFSASTCSFLVPLGWAWLQGNSRARRLRSAVRARRVWVSLPDCRLRLSQKHKQSAPDPPKSMVRHRIASGYSKRRSDLVHENLYGLQVEHPFLATMGSVPTLPNKLARS